MGDSPNLVAIRELLSLCSLEEQKSLFRELRQLYPIHEFEQVIGAPAEMILEAVHRAPELTRRMLRGVIADAAFRTFVVPAVQPQGWRDVTPVGNFSYDYKLEDGQGSVTVQVKLQRSERGAPVERDGHRYGFNGPVFMTETQKTRTGSDGNEKTRPYRYGEFDILAVSMQPSCGKWDSYMYTLGRWLLPGKNAGEVATMQPVAKTANNFWTDNFCLAAAWFRAEDGGKRLKIATVAQSRRTPRKTPRKVKNRTPDLF
jgi:hypothetical protein